MSSDMRMMIVILCEGNFFSTSSLENGGSLEQLAMGNPITVIIWWANLCPGILIMNALQCSKYSGMS